ncbi:FhuF-like iron-sulfur protein [Nocardiopsis sp. L17-MgMaSL7]|nr:FhuF-like iron-sulfur protein [Nocardiopsis sp. L17-MgMaSL7]
MVPALPAWSGRVGRRMVQGGGSGSSTGGVAVLERVLEDVGGVNTFFRVGSAPLGGGWKPVTAWDGRTESGRERVAVEVDRVRAQLGAVSGVGAEDVEWRVGASLFHQGLASRLLSPVLAAGLCHGVALRADLFVHEPGRSGSLELRTEQTRAVPLSREPREVAAWVDETVVGGVLTHVEEALTGIGRVSPGLLRGDTGAALAGAARALGGARVGQRAHAEEVVRVLMDRPSLRGTGAYVGADRTGSAVFRRTTCCLYYRLPGGGLCGDCALRHPHTALHG